MAFLSDKALVFFGTMIALFLRAATTLHPYSGEGKPPMYGDYEAQRHWMEVTYNLPIEKWYFNSSDNDLMYWGLDYPPLTAYHMYACGIVANWLNKSYVELHKSRGIESEDHKFFMRNTVLLADVLVYIPGVLFYFWTSKSVCEEDDLEIKGVKKKKQAKKAKTAKFSIYLGVVLSLFYPGIILIDHGHFQYNCVSLGFTVISIGFLYKNRDLLASFFFVLALCYKQMELYHALPYFMYLFSSSIPKPGQTSLSGLFKLTKLAFVVLGTFVIIWAPFLFDFKSFFQVLHRLFPIARGVFEDKVANVWCSLNIFYKFKSMFCESDMLRYCTIATLTASIPSLIDLFLRPNIKKFVLSLINTSLAFFLFSYQVHEKSILLVAIPVMLQLPNDPIPCFWFLVISSFSMLPLLIKDGLVIAFIALQGFYITSFYLSYTQTFKVASKHSVLREYYRDIVNTLVEIHKKKKTYFALYNVTAKHILKNRDFLRKVFLYLTFVLSLLGAFGLFFAALVFDPPEKYPDLYPLLISVYSCLHFVGFFVYFNVVQIMLPQSFAVPQVKVKTS